jgi:hypothetical protein
MNGKHVVMATLISVILLTVVFTSFSSQQSVHEYDPWRDTNDDGIIDIYARAPTY